MLCWMVFPYLVAGLGVLFYISHFPERLIPGQVDIYGASHQIWHLLIFSGMASWYWLSCWVSVTRPEKCILLTDPDDSLQYNILNSTFGPTWL